MAALQQPAETTSPESLDHALAPLAARLRTHLWVRYASRGALAGTCVAIVGVVLAHLNFLPDALPLEALVPSTIALGVVAGTIPALLKRITTMDAARIAETRLGLKERLSSALEFENSTLHNGSAAVLVRLQHVDALGHAHRVSNRDAAPFRATWEIKALAAALAVLALALVLPNLPIFVPAGLRVEHSIVHKEGDKLVVKAKTIEKFADAHRLPQTKRAAQDMRRLGEQMSRSHMDKKQALLKYSQLTRQMQEIQKKLTDAAAAGQASKSLSQAGKQLSQALAADGAGGQSGKNAMSGNPAAAGKTSGSAKGAQQNTKPGDKDGKKPGEHGFNVPGMNQNKPGEQNPQDQTAQKTATDEVKKAAAAMKQGDISGLSDQLRKLADRVQNGQLTPQEQQQAQQDLQKLADALKGTPLKETQQHSQAAADAMKKGDKQQAAQEMRKAAEAAEREMQQQMEAQAMGKAQKSLEKSQSEMAGASSPSDIGQESGDSGQEGQDSGESGEGGSNASEESAADKRMHSGDGQGKGKDGDPGTQPGEEGGGAGAGNRAGHGHGKRGSGKVPKQKFSKFQGPVPHNLNPKFDPSKSPKYAKIYAGKPGQGTEAGRLGKAMKVRPGAAPPGGARSNVPYYDYVGEAKRAAEKSVDSESIPPAYRDEVRKYFNSITPDGK